MSLKISINPNYNFTLETEALGRIKVEEYTWRHNSEIISRNENFDDFSPDSFARRLLNITGHLYDSDKNIIQKEHLSVDIVDEISDQEMEFYAKKFLEKNDILFKNMVSVIDNKGNKVFDNEDKVVVTDKLTLNIKRKDETHQENLYRVFSEYLQEQERLFAPLTKALNTFGAVQGSISDSLNQSLQDNLIVSASLSRDISNIGNRLRFGEGELYDSSAEDTVSPYKIKEIKDKKDLEGTGTTDYLKDILLLISSTSKVINSLNSTVVKEIAQISVNTEKVNQSGTKSLKWVKYSMIAMVFVMTIQIVLDHQSSKKTNELLSTIVINSITKEILAPEILIENKYHDVEELTVAVTPDTDSVVVNDDSTKLIVPSKTLMEQ